MAMNHETRLRDAYDLAQERYAAFIINADKVFAQLAKIY